MVLQTCVDMAMEELAKLGNEQHLTSAVKDQIQKVQEELRFLKMFFWCLLKWKKAGKDVHLKSAINTIKSALEVAQKGLYSAGLDAIRKNMGRNWRVLTSNLLAKIEQFKSEIRKNYKFVFDCPLESKKSYANDEILEILDCVILSMNHLSNSKNQRIDSVKNQIGALERKLKLLRDFLDFTAKRCSDHEKLEDFLSRIQAWANTAAWLAILYWINPPDRNMEDKLNMMLSDLLTKIHPCNSPEILGMYLGVLKASKSSRPDTFLMGQIVARFVDLLLENLVIPRRDCLEILQEGLIFLITFLMDPPEEYPEEGKLILARGSTIVAEAASMFCSQCLEEMNGDLATERDAILDDFVEKVRAIKGEVTELFVKFPNSIEFKFFRTNAIRFTDFILENLEKMLQCNVNFIPFEKQKVLRIQRELQYLMHFLKDIESQRDKEQLKDIWTRIIDLAYRAEHAIDLCLVMDSPIWYTVICLSLVIEEIQLIKTDVVTLQDEHIMSKIGSPSTVELNSMPACPTQATTSRIDEVIVGFEDEAKSIIDQLISGSSQLEIISIVGMPGQGKTTLAKKVYNHPSVQLHFNQRAWCCISQVYRYRDLLLDILSNMVDLNDHETSKMTDDELADWLRKCLLGQKYLIVMDDIWDLRAWNDLKESFPDKNIGSRILFTSRIHSLAWQDELKCIFHPLRQFSDEESWELLQEKIFGKDGCPQDLLPVGKEIAKDCKGLPLSIVLIAGLLARRKYSPEWWKQIASRLNSRLPSDGCMDILELSYRHLPDYLKPCFLYFGAFAEDAEIRVRKLMQLWVAEGFIERKEMKSSKDIAMEYLMDLISRSLVIVTQRSSKGGIKACCVHDLLRDMCLTKAKEGNFLQLVHVCDIQSDSFDPIKYKYYRLCIDPGHEFHIHAKPIHSSVHSLFVCKSRRAHYIDSSIFQIFRLLKVLDLGGIWLDYSFPEDIALLVHMRYLAFSGDFTEVPSSIANLWNLETLILEGKMLWGVRLPDIIWKMQSLRHLFVRESAYFYLDRHEVGESAQLDNLHTFSSVALRDARDAKRLLRRLPRLQKLSCTFTESIDCYTKCYEFPPFSCLSELESLNMVYVGYVFNIEHAFSDILCSQLPALNFPETLRKLTVSGFCLSKSGISTIAQLSNLEVLKFRKMAFEKCKWLVKDEDFLKLKFLEISSSEIEEWNASTEPFPILEQLVLANCTKLKGIPFSFANIYTLKMIKLRHCSPRVETTAQEVLQEQRDLGNDDLNVICL